MGVTMELEFLDLGEGDEGGGGQGALEPVDRSIILSVMKPTSSPLPGDLGVVWVTPRRQSPDCEFGDATAILKSLSLNPNAATFQAFNSPTQETAPKQIQSDHLARQPPLPSDQLPPSLQWQQPEHVALERQQSLGQQRQLVHHQQTSNDLDKPEPKKLSATSAPFIPNIQIPIPNSHAQTIHINNLTTNVNYHLMSDNNQQAVKLPMTTVEGGKPSVPLQPLPFAVNSSYQEYIHPFPAQGYQSPVLVYQDQNINQQVYFPRGQQQPQQQQQGVRNQQQQPQPQQPPQRNSQQQQPFTSQGKREQVLSFGSAPPVVSIKDKLASDDEEQQQQQLPQPKQLQPRQVEPFQQLPKQLQPRQVEPFQQQQTRMAMPQQVMTKPFGLTQDHVQTQMDRQTYARPPLPSAAQDFLQQQQQQQHQNQHQQQQLHNSFYPQPQLPTERSRPAVVMPPPQSIAASDYASVSAPQMLPASSARDVMSPPRYAATTEKVSAMLQQHNPPTQQQSPVIQQQQEQRPVQEQRPHGLQRPEPTLEQIQRVIDMQAREEALAEAKKKADEEEKKSLEPIPATTTATVTVWGGEEPSTPEVCAWGEEPAAEVKQEAEEPEPVKPAAPSSWASLFSANKQTPASPLPANIKPMARISPYKSADPNQPAHSTADVESKSIELGRFLMGYTLNHSAPSILPCGLSNRSNWCFVNAILQALLGCPPFYNLFKKIPLVPGMTSKPTHPMMESLIEFVHESAPMDSLVKTASKKDKGRKKEELRTGPCKEPTYVYKMLLNLASENFNVVEGRQEDAEEFLTCLLNGLSDEMTELMKLVPKKEEGVRGEEDGEEGEGEDGDDWQEVDSRGRSAVTRRVVAPSESPVTPIQAMALGMSRSSFRSAGSETSATLQPFFTLQLDIQAKEVNSINEALSATFANEDIDGYTCPKTKQVIQASKSLRLEELPSILILHMKRFVYDGSTGGVQKVMKQIDFTVDLDIPKTVLSTEARPKYQNVKQRQYKLFAVVYHNGREATKGHYVTDMYHSGNGAWIHCDDSTLTETAEQSVLNPGVTSTPYILFYRRCDTMVGGDKNKEKPTKTN